MLVGGVVGASVGALAAVIGSNEVFVCQDNPPVLSAACAGGSDILAVMWGVPIGLLVGLAAGLAITWSRRRSDGLPN